MSEKWDIEYSTIEHLMKELNDRNLVIHHVMHGIKHDLERDKYIIILDYNY